MDTDAFLLEISFKRQEGLQLHGVEGETYLPYDKAEQYFESFVAPVGYAA